MRGPLEMELPRMPFGRGRSQNEERQRKFNGTDGDIDDRPLRIPGREGVIPDGQNEPIWSRREEGPPRSEFLQNESPLSNRSIRPDFLGRTTVSS